jgi:hypothetical protein
MLTLGKGKAGTPKRSWSRIPSDDSAASSRGAAIWLAMIAAAKGP